MDEYIGNRKIKEAKDFAQDGIGLVRVEYESGDWENLSKLMFDAVVSPETCDLTQLRHKRMIPVAKEVLGLLRNWGVKNGEVAYLITLVNDSFIQNEKEALKELWSEFIPNLEDPDNVSLIDIDLVLKRKGDKAILSPYGNKE